MVAEQAGDNHSFSPDGGGDGGFSIQSKEGGGRGVRKKPKTRFCAKRQERYRVVEEGERAYCSTATFFSFFGKDVLKQNPLCQLLVLYRTGGSRQDQNFTLCAL